MNPSISVCIPTKNRSKFLLAALDSILSQSILPDSIEISEAGNTNNTTNSISELLSSSPIPINIYDNSGSNRINNWLNALDRSSSQYKLILCDDDLLEPLAIEKFLSLIERFPDNGIYACRQKIISLDGSVKYTSTFPCQTSRKICLDKLLIKYGFPGFPSLVINSALLSFREMRYSLFYESDYICDLFLLLESYHQGIAFSSYVASSFQYQQFSQSTTGGISLYWPMWPHNYTSIIP